MTTIASAAPATGSQPASQDPCFLYGVSLSETLQESIQKVQAETGAPDPVVRCEKLPPSCACAADARRLFDSLLRLIFSTPPVGPQLFLHVDCMEEKGGRDENIYLIRFHANIAAAGTWATWQEELLNESRKMAVVCGGALHVNRVTRNGCLFSVSLPCKM